VNAFSIADIRHAVLGSGRIELLREDCRPSAVLVPLVYIEDEWHFLFTKRTEDLEHHRGQVSFPGGALEENEPSESAALRETFEEIGIPAHAIEVIGFLHDIRTPSRYTITPVVGIVHSLDRLSINTAEVSKTFTVPLKFFIDDANTEIRTITLHGISRDVYFYRYDGETIWGATAVILRDLIQRLNEGSHRSNGRK
jgi:8-oxo-dGTP pyrophosphatase MutT (NUDIX family)